MKILVCARHFGYLRNFESALVELARRGHILRLLADREDASGGLAMVERLAARFPGVTIGWTPRRDRTDLWVELASRIRLSQDYLRYLEHTYDVAPMLRRRAKERTPPGTVWLVERAGFRFRPGRALLRWLFAVLEDGVPAHPPYVRLMHDERPDAVILTPLIDLGSPQLDLLKGARAAGCRTMLAVGSWDHLSSKALIRIQPDVMTVWNETQRREAIEMHGVPPERIAVTGAQCYDQWFDRTPSRPRDAFCRDMGLRPDRPFVLYVCSSLFRGDPPEVEFTRRWIRAVRESADETLAGLGILLRPHPGRLDEWRGQEAAGLDVAVHGSNPIDDLARADYFDALFYASAVVGLNTSAFLEAGIAGKPLLAILQKEFWKSQQGTIHFRYLTEVGGGLLQTADSIDEHLRQLSAAVASGGRVDHNGFLEAFIRPFGLREPATPRFADAVEGLTHAPSPAPVEQTWYQRGTARVLRAYGHAASVRSRAPHLAQSAARAVRKRYQRSTRAIERRRRRGRDEITRLSRVLKPSTTRRRALRLEDFDRSDEIRHLLETLEDVRRSRRPVVVGPWMSEVGFELLYWIPFLRWAKSYAQVRRERVVVLSRGGAASWYGDIGGRYVEVFDLCSVEEFRSRNQQRVTEADGQKHFSVSVFDEEMLGAARRRLGLGPVDWLHPSLMYGTFRPFWIHAAGWNVVRRYTAPRTLSVPSREAAATLPRPYVAVKLYSNDGLPAGSVSREFTGRLLSRLTGRGHVVLLHGGRQYDDHVDLPIEHSERVVQVEHLLTPSNNLDVQTQIVTAAQAFVCTYGGFSYLGPLCGTPTVGLYSDPQGFRQDHLAVALRTFRERSAAPYVVMSLDDAAFAESTLGGPGAPGPIPVRDQAYA
ncbi:MAG: hypothetical protein AB1806_18175 [Acidobacteriota bacterium]